VPVEGYSATIPHKEAAALAGQMKDEPATLTRAANTLIRKPFGFFAANTDYPAIMAALSANLARPNGPTLDLHKRMALILGAGGVARAAAHALSKAGAIVHIANRDPERAEKLAHEINGEALDWTARHKEGCDLVINCTPVGMHPNIDESPLHSGYLRPGMVVFDTVYTPETTMLIREAKARGAQVITGVELFIRQAGAQFELFTGIQPPLEVMGKVLRRALSPVTLHDEE
jgi:3-dehydroquinate dehydratase/shikimate dehydrogenase